MQIWDDCIICNVCDACLNAKDDWFVWDWSPFSKAMYFLDLMLTVFVFVWMPARWILFFLVTVNVSWTIG